MEVNIPTGYCHCGCGEKTTIITKNNSKSGYVKGEYYKYVKNHGKRSSPTDFIVDEETGCWEWQRGKTKSGYGQLQIRNKKIYAHRYYYEKYVSVIPKGMEIDHICHNRACVNPKHLRLATRFDNCHNQRIKSKQSSIYKGVYWSKTAKKWVAQIVHNKETTYLGLFKDEIVAAKLYDQAAKKYFGEFANLNFKEE